MGQLRNRLSAPRQFGVDAADSQRAIVNDLRANLARLAMSVDQLAAHNERTRVGFQSERYVEPTCDELANLVDYRRARRTHTR